MLYWADEMARADAILLGRVTYQMMESAWRKPNTGVWPDWMEEWEIPFAENIDTVPKYVVSSTLDHLDWNSELELWTRAGHIKVKLGKGIDVRRLDNLISYMVLNSR